MTHFDDFSDPLEDLIGAPLRPAPAKPVSETIQQAAFFDRCTRCAGTGMWRGRGKCFACQGKGGKTFKTSAADRAANRQQAAVRTARKEEDRLADFSKEFKAEHAWMVTKAPTFEFARNMLEAVTKYGHLTEKQLAAVRKCATQDEQRKVESQARIDNAKAVDASKITEAFAHARA